MTLLLASHATDGLVALSDRKETYQRGLPKDVKKHLLDKRRRFYISLAGDGKLAEGVLRRLARARTGPADVLARIRGIAKDLHSGPQRIRRVSGFLITVERSKLRLYTIAIAGSHVAALEKHGGVHARGDGSARTLCEYITKKSGLAGMRCEEAARHLHVLASDVAEHVDSVGERDKYGFDLVVFAAGGTKLAERDKERRGRIDVSFRMDGPAGSPAAHGGDAP